MVLFFRKWSNKVLKEYLLKGYVVNQKRLEYLEKTIKLIDIAGRIDTELKGTKIQEIIKIINNYSNALNLLDDYDHKRITKPNGTKNNKQVIDNNTLVAITLLIAISNPIEKEILIDLIMNFFTS